MVGKTKTWTKAQRERARALKELGCIVCRDQGMGWRLPDIHHILHAGKRMGHDYTIPLDPWFHEGHPPEGMDERSAYEFMGPSLKLHKREFITRFGDELAVLERVNAQLENADG